MFTQVRPPSADKEMKEMEARAFINLNLSPWSSWSSWLLLWWWWWFYHNDLTGLEPDHPWAELQQATRGKAPKYSGSMMVIIVMIKIKEEIRNTFRFNDDDRYDQNHEMMLKIQSCSHTLIALVQDESFCRWDISENVSQNFWQKLEIDQNFWQKRPPHYCKELKKMVFCFGFGSSRGLVRFPDPP